MDKIQPTAPELTHEEGLEIIDQASRHYLNMPASEFLKKWDSGYFKGHRMACLAADVALLLPLIRR